MKPVIYDMLCQTRMDQLGMVFLFGTMAAILRLDLTIEPLLGRFDAEK